MSANATVFLIRFEGLSLAEANIEAAGLREAILDAAPVEVSLIKENPSTQDLGTVLSLVLGSAAITAVANGIANYLSRGRATITIGKDGKVIATGLQSTDAARIAEAFAGKEPGV